MNKVQVLKPAPCRKPSKKELESAEFKGYERLLAKAQIIMADRKPVLNIDLFRQVETAKGGSVLAARYFAEKETGTYKALVRTATGEQVWRRLNIDNVAKLTMEGFVTPGGCYWWRFNPWWEYATEKDRKIADTYLRESVGTWENSVNSKKYYRAQNRKQDRITEMMDRTVPSVPEGFDNWIRERAFPREYAFVRKPKKEGGMYRYFCTACGGNWRRKNTEGIGYITCRRCGERILTSWKEKEMSAEEQVFLLQPCLKNDGTWVERAFKVRAAWECDQAGKTVMIDEQIRIIIPKNGTWGSCYYEVGIYEDKRLFWDRNTGSRRIKAGFLYDGNREEVEACWCSALKHSGIWMLAAREKVNVNNMIINARSRPYMEYLLKGKFFRIAGEIAKGSMKEHSYLHKGSSPGEVFLLSNDRVDRLRRMDGGFTILTWLAEEERTGKRITQENLEWTDRHGISADDSDIRAMIQQMGSTNVVINYIRKQCGNHKKTPRDVMATWRDYIRMAELQGLNISHEIFYKPKDVYAAHDACVREGQKKETLMRAKEILKKFPDVEKVLEEIRDKYTYDGEQYCIVVPENVQDIIHEGRALGHCIDTTDRYFDRIEQETSYLVFLRKKETRGVPWYTLEIEPGGTVRQQRTTGNAQNKADAKKYTPFLREWQKVVRERISEEDRKLAEKSRQTRILEYADLRAKKEKVRRGKLAGQLLADVLEADLLEVL